MIGFFDSGFGGLTIMKEVREILPDHSFIYLGDNARTPYGPHSDETIYQYTLEGVDYLFRQGATIVILACNTASAVALKKLQQGWLKEKYPNKKVLGILEPTAEDAINFISDNVALFATEATVKSGAFEREITKTDPSVTVFSKACPLIVPIIESGELDRIDDVVRKYVSEVFERKVGIGDVILGCTHYAIVEDVFRRHIPENVRIVSQGKLVAESLERYLERHVEIENGLEKQGVATFLTTESSPHIQRLARMFYGQDIDLGVVDIKS